MHRLIVKIIAKKQCEPGDKLPGSNGHHDNYLKGL